MRILVTGSRHGSDRELVKRTLDDLRLSYEHDDVTLIDGACHLGGYDLLCHEYALAHGWATERYPVCEELDGLWPAAGPRRNQRMLDASNPDICVVFPGHNGTSDMKRRARKAGVTIRYAR